MGEARPDIVHVTGIDNRSGRQILGREGDALRDGLFLSDASGNAVEHRAEQIARLLNAGAPSPLFVGFNCWDSGARLAPMTIQSGAGAAIGFQHTFDDEVAEVFFLNFYRTCMRSGWNTLAGFVAAWESVAAYRDRIRGSSLTLWSADSLLSGPVWDEFRRWRAGRSADASADRVQPRRSRAADPARDRLAELLSVTVRPKSQLNYSSLHNGENLFDEFTFRLSPGLSSRRLNPPPQHLETSGPLTADDSVVARVDDIDVEVSLQIDSHRFPFRTRTNIGTDQYRRDLSDAITLPLTGEVFRSVNERIRVTIDVDVQWQGQVLHRHTYPVWLAPADQWTLDSRQIGWLPSFVQPRDPAVSHTVGIARGYLQCLCDRVSAGFDGYQSYDGYASGLGRWDGVDRQVQSLWAALVFGTRLHYINPPPSYAEFTQRLRTPGETLAGGFGTCVDLAILFASCLEWVEIHPVLFLLNGHVFPGYWKDAQAHRRYMDVLIEEATQPSEIAELPDDHAPHRWVAGPKTYPEIKGFVDRGELIPVETVGLTKSVGFRAAIDDGRTHFANARSRAFRAMIDLISARTGNGVTPLPIRFEQRDLSRGGLNDGPNFGRGDSTGG